MDIPLLIIGALLLGTLTAWHVGMFPYPVGWLLLSVFFIARLIQISQG
ncbi:hypothetical protein [Ectothiorhodospira shaposhnikovii]|nr:hypothetical protein [Ectothiorhodospira shaposhnikovii]MCG5512365.1 hypothetical protein [Ectothiorhodospira shaposhnikovii]